MKHLTRLIKYLWTVSNNLVCILLVWIFNVSPLHIYSKITGWSIPSSLPLTATAAIDLAVILFLYNNLGFLLSKLFSLLIKPVKVNLSIIDPSNPSEHKSILYDLQSGLKKLKFRVSISYKNGFFKTVSTLGLCHIVELHWGQWLEVDVRDDASSRLSGESGNNYWRCYLTRSMGTYDVETSFELPFYFTVRNNVIRKGFITPKIKLLPNSKFVNALLVLLTYPIVSVNEQRIEITLAKE
jgi:hypothetical protein